MTNILMVTIKFPPFFAGAAVQAIYLAHELSNQGLNIQFITDNDAGPTVDEEYQGLRVHRFSTFTSKGGTILKELVYLARVYFYILTHPRFKIVHFHSIKGYEAFLFPLIKMLGRKIILKMTLVGSDDPVTFSRRKVGSGIMLGLKCVDAFVAISTRLKELAVEAGIPQQKVHLIYNGTDTDKFSPVTSHQRQELRERFGFDSSSLIFCSIGKVEHRKGYDLLLNAWIHITNDFPNALLLIAGMGNDNDNPYYRSLLATCKANNLENVRFVGQINNVHHYMRLSDCFVFCSRSEGFGTVLIEALSSGVPVVATNIPGVTEDIIGGNEMGRISYSENPTEFARLVRDVLESEDAVAKSGAVRNVRDRFSIKRIATSYEALYGALERDGDAPVSVRR